MSEPITDTELAEWRAACEALESPRKPGVPVRIIQFAHVARSAMPRLLDEVERLRQQLAAERDIRNWYEVDHEISEHDCLPGELRELMKVAEAAEGGELEKAADLRKEEKEKVARCPWGCEGTTFEPIPGDSAVSKAYQRCTTCQNFVPIIEVSSAGVEMIMVVLAHPAALTVTFSNFMHSMSR